MADKIAKNPLILISLVFISGIIIGKYFLFYPHSLLITVCFYLIFILTKLLHLNLTITSIFLLLSLTLSGALRYDLATEIQPINQLSRFDPDSIKSITGIIDQVHCRQNNHNTYIVKAVSVNINDCIRPVSNKILLSTKNITGRFQYGDLIRINGLLQVPPAQRNPGQFNYRSYLASQDIFFIVQIQHADSIIHIQSAVGNFFIQTIICPIKRYCEQTFFTHLNSQTSALLQALLLGEKQDLDKNMIRHFQEIGIVHVLAISGLHVGFIILFVFLLFSVLHIPYKFKIYGLIGVLSMYNVLVQFRPSVIRASLMAVLFLMGRLNERKIMTYNIIFGSGLIILFINPRELFNPGFQFSFIAVLSIVYGHDKLDGYLPAGKFQDRNRCIGKLAGFFQKNICTPFLISLAAVIGTLPVTVYYYGMIPVIAVLTNLVVIPLVGIIVLLGIFLLIFSLISPFLAQGVGMIINYINTGLQIFVKYIAAWPFVSIHTIKPSLLMTFSLLSALLFILNLNKVWARRWLIFIITCWTLFFLQFKFFNKHCLEVTFLDVGQGDAAFLKFPNDNTMLIDTGDASPYWDNGLNTILPFLKHRGILHINYLLGSHAHNDHIGGFCTLMQTISIDTVVLSPYVYNSDMYASVVHLCNTEHIPVKYVKRGDLLYPDKNCRVYVLHPTQEFSTAKTYSGAECNNSSIVLKIQYGENGILFSGDLERNGELPILNFASFLECEILKVGHHGSKTSNTQELLNLIQPILAVISVAKQNKFNHPSSETLSRLDNSGVHHYLTSQEGAVMFELDMTEIKKLPWRNN